MGFLLDTNVVSECFRTTPNKKVFNWINGVSPKLNHLSAITVGEIKKGIKRLPDSKLKSRLTNWLEADIYINFENRIIPIGTIIAEKWGDLMGQQKSLPPIDTLLAATALIHNLTLVTRNTKDFSNIPGLETFNPWEE